MNGVRIIKEKGHCCFYIDIFSDELKNAIRENFTGICWGNSDADSTEKMYSYKSTLVEFLKRYEAKEYTHKIGLIGELLLHILLHIELSDYSISSPYFNLEERNVKKGFDVVLNKPSKNNELWIVEVKSGNMHKEKSASQTIIELINTAKNDLYERLNGECNSLWLNAVNGARQVYDNYPDRKKAVLAILREKWNEADEKKLKSSDVNVFLVGTLFHELKNDVFDQDKVWEKKEKIRQKSIFKEIFVVAIQKNTHDAIFKFLKSESQL